jgi:glucose/arabinose dehydrogenase
MPSRWILATRGPARILGLAAAALVAAAPPVFAQTPLTTELVVNGLQLPVVVTHAPLDFTRLFVVEQPGRVRIVDLTQTPPALLPAPLLDIDPIVAPSGGEQGLLGLAFHPRYAENGFFFVKYSNNAGDNVIARFHVPPETPDTADPASQAVLLTIDQPQSNHNGGWIAFGPRDGYLYVATGDGGGSGDTGTGHSLPFGNAQDLTDNLLGKLLRLDVDATDQGNYGIPPSNPFVGISGDDEIWAWGLRNPWRNAFDPATGDLYIADVGQGAWEEVNFQPAASPGGENWGWRCREGAHPFDAGCSATPGLIDPVHEYDHSVGRSITGGEVYRGCAIPDLRGAYFFADYITSRIWSFEISGGTVTNLIERTAELDPAGALAIANPSSFGTDAYREIYIADRPGGEIFRIVATGGSSGCDADDDTDGIPDLIDNCSAMNNPTQLDADLDGFGNGCDADFDQNGLCGGSDANTLRQCFGAHVGVGVGPPEDPRCAESDMSGGGIVGGSDFNLLRFEFGTAPGPSGWLAP